MVPPLHRFLRILIYGLCLAGSVGSATESSYQDRYRILGEELRQTLPQIDPALIQELDRLQAEVEEALRLRKAVEKELSGVESARGLVKHAKNHWIRKAEKNLAQATARLEEARSREEREQAREEMAKWEQNRQAGEDALKERQARWEAVKDEEPRIKKELEMARAQVEAARTRLMKATADEQIRSLVEREDLDGKLAAFVALHAATPQALDAYAALSTGHRDRLERLFADESLLIQMAVADGPGKNRYGPAMEIYETIQASSDQASSGILQRLAVAISLEHAEPRKQRNAKAAENAPAMVDPVARYLSYEQAFLHGELDPNFEGRSVWELRFVVNGEEPDEIAAWGRQMLWNYRPDHILNKDHRWRYVMLVRTDVPYGSQDNKYDREDLQFFQNILMNGGVCGRRAFIGRFILRSFGVPTIARPSPGHGALARWTPDGWVVCLGPKWGLGHTHGRYGKDLNFLASAHARELGDSYLQVKRGHWIGDVMGEPRSWGLIRQKRSPEFWNRVALYTQRRLIEDANMQALAAVGEAFGEKDETEHIPSMEDAQLSRPSAEVTSSAGRGIQVQADAFLPLDEKFLKIKRMPSVLGGTQLLHPRQGASEAFLVPVTVPETGIYELRARVVTPSWQQKLRISVNGSKQEASLPLPHTVGLWEMTEPVSLQLEEGAQVLQLFPQTDGKPKGFAIHAITLHPASGKKSL